MTNKDLSFRLGESQIPYDFAWIPPGIVSVPFNAPAESDDQTFQITVTQGFWMGKTLLSRAIYEDIISSNITRNAIEINEPINMISWDDCIVFCKKLNSTIKGSIPNNFHFSIPSIAQFIYCDNLFSGSNILYDLRGRIAQWAFDDFIDTRFSDCSDWIYGKKQDRVLPIKTIYGFQNVDSKSLLSNYQESIAKGRFIGFRLAIVAESLFNSY